MKTKRSHYVVRVDNSCWQPLPRVGSLLKSGSAQCSDFYLQVRVDIVWISVRRRCIHLPLLRQNGLYRSVELVFVHNYAGVRFLLFQTHVVQSDGAGRAAGDGAHCAARRTERHPAPYGKQRSVGPRRHNKLKVTSPDHFTSSVMTEATVQYTGLQSWAMEIGKPPGWNASWIHQPSSAMWWSMICT